MTVTTKTPRRWDTLEYQQIVSASHHDGELVVGFADGTEVRVSPRCLIAPDAPTADWSNLSIEEFHLTVPSPAGEIEIPWDVIRVQTDPAFDAFWARLVTERAAATTLSGS